MSRFSTDRRTPPSAAALMVLVRHVRPIFRHLTRAVEDTLAGTGLSVPLRGLMERLYESGPASVPGLARSLGLPRQYAQTLVDEAVALGFVERRPNPAHRTSPLNRLTDEGRLAVEALLARETAALESVAGRFDADEVEVAARVMADLLAAFQSMTAGPAVRPGTGPDAPPTPPTG